MTESTLIPFLYRDFYDIPRAVVVELENEPYLLDCVFDCDSDDYSQFYEVYRLRRSVVEGLGSSDWTNLSETGEFVGKIAVDRVKFDETKRKLLSSSELVELIADHK